MARRDVAAWGGRGGFLALAGLAWLAANAAAADVYKWVDDQGRVHYGDSPPGDAQAQTLRTPAPPSEDEVLRARSRLDAAVEQANAGRADAQDRRRDEAQVRQEELERRARCRSARQELEILRMERPVYRLDEGGQRVYLEDDQRARDVARVRERIDEFCP